MGFVVNGPPDLDGALDGGGDNWVDGCGGRWVTEQEHGDGGLGRVRIRCRPIKSVASWGRVVGRKNEFTKRGRR